MNLSGLVDLYKNPGLAEWISTTDKLFSNKEIRVTEAVQTFLVCLMNLAVEQGVPIPDTTSAPGKCMGGRGPGRPSEFSTGIFCTTQLAGSGSFASDSTD